jgi:hypothetical protein
VFFIMVVSAGSLRAQAGGGFAELGDVFNAYVAVTFIKFVCKCI